MGHSYLPIIFFFMIEICSSADKLGDRCVTDSACTRYFEQCTDGHCKCSDQAAEYYDNGILKCNYTFPVSTLRNKELCEESCKEPRQCNKYGYCVCIDPKQVLSDGVCTNVVWRSVRESCQSNSTVGAFACNYKDNLVCKSGRCACFQDMFVERNGTMCKPKTVYTKLNKITSYKAMVGDYCVDRSDCIAGLDCGFDMRCKCPSGCQYIEDRLSCDCGTITYATPVAPIITGLILGLLSFICWGSLIRRNLQSSKSRRNEDYDNCGMDEIPESSPDDNKPPIHDPPPPYPEDGNGLPPVGFNPSVGDPTNAPYPVNPQPSAPYPAAPNPAAPYPVAPMAPYPPSTDSTAPYPPSSGSTAPYPTSQPPSYNPSSYPVDPNPAAPGFAKPDIGVPYPVAPSSASEPPYPK